MNTSKQINIMVLLVFLSVFATGAYWLWDPNRADDAEAKQEKATIERGAWLFSQNCRTCHGDMGEGGAASNRLRAAPALNRPDLQGRTELDGAADNTAKALQYKLIVNTITCGRVGKAMPTWGQSQGGTLNDEQIRQLATFINEGTGWETAKEYAIDGYPPADKHGDDVNHLTLAEALSADSDRVVLNRVPDSIAEDVRLQFGQEDGDEIVLVKEVDAANNAVVVERGVGTTDAEDHPAGTVVLEVPEPPGDPVATVQAACGQTAGAGTVAPVEPPSATLSITAQAIAWNKTTLAAIADVPLTLTVTNNDAGTAHNIHFTQGAEPGGPELDPPAMTEIENGPNVQTLNFGPLVAGDYFYVCDVHTNMEGVLTASAAGAAPAAGAGAAATPAP